MNSIRIPLLSTLLLLITIQPLLSQSMDDALELYHNEEYQEAADLFQQLDGDEALLFSGKSHLALGNHLLAARLLEQVTQAGDPLLRQESLYTLAITHFRLKNYTKSLELLYQLELIPDRTGLQQEARTLYQDILLFLNDRQRLQVFQQLDSFEIRADLIRTSISRSDFSLIQAMISELEQIADIDGDRSVITELRRLAGDERTYTVDPDLRTVTPQGMIYNIGVALPSFDVDDPEFIVPRNLYFGILLAAEEFNARNADRKVFLHFLDTGSDPDQIGSLFQQFLWQHHVDAIIGPLFSDTAVSVSELARMYELPVLAPLANSDTINSGHPYTYQLNPTFSVHGREMARFAVNELQLDTLAIVTERGSLGSSSAQSFRREAENLGAYIAYYFDEDFSQTGYDLSDITEVFTPDSELIDSLGYTPVDGIYAPFTGQAAGTLTRLLLTDLEAMNAELVVMGSEEWREINFSERQRSLFHIYYSEPTYSEPDPEQLEYFDQDFLNRFNVEADNFAKIGYDTGNYLFHTLERNGNPQELYQYLAEAPLFHGLAMQIYFNGNRINQSVSIRSKQN